MAKARCAGEFAGAVLTDDLVALEVLGATGTIPSASVRSVSPAGWTQPAAGGVHRVAACAVSCMMATFASLVPAELIRRSTYPACRSLTFLRALSAGWAAHDHLNRAWATNPPPGRPVPRLAWARKPL